MIPSLGSALCGAVYNIATRKVGGTDRAETSLFYATLVGVMGAALPLHWVWRLPAGFFAAAGAAPSKVGRTSPEGARPAMPRD
jgi:drug/metabolite transporter (DMT)-like permease